MNYLKKNNGITMISLVVTITVLLILSVIGVKIGTSSISSTIDSKLTSELQMVQHAVLEQYSKYELTKDASYLLGNKITNDELKTITNEMGITLVNIPDTYKNKDYYKLDKATLLDLGIKDTNDEYIVNYISGEVINITKKQTGNGNKLYITGKSF